MEISIQSVNAHQFKQSPFFVHRKKHLENGFKNLTEKGEVVKFDKKSTNKVFNIVGMMYTCKTDLCNASNRLSEPALLLAVFGGLMLFFRSRPSSV